VRDPGPGACRPQKAEVNVLARRVPLRRNVPLRRCLPPKRRVPVRRQRPEQRRGPARSPEYLAWIRMLPCVVCSRVSGGATVIEAAHTNALGSRGMSQKTTDFSAIPLCLGIIGSIQTLIIVWEKNISYGHSSWICRN